MKKTCLLFSLLIWASISFGQKPAPKTIFEVFDVSNTSCATSESNGEGLEEAMGIAEPVGIPANIQARTAKLLAAKDKIEHHIANSYIVETGPKRFYDLFVNNKLVSYLLKEGETYTLCNKDGKVIWKKEFTYVEKTYHDLLGFNTYNKTNLSTYYDHTGKVITAGQYEYAEGDHGYFRVLKDGKWGLIDRSGKLVLPVMYNYVSHFNSGNKLYFLISEKGPAHYYMEAATKKKYYISSSQPGVIQNRYWVTDGKVYDPVTNKRLFCKIPGYIERAGSADLLRISAKNIKGDYFFDGQGRLLGGNTAVSSLRNIKDNLFIVSVHTDKDPDALSRRVNPPKKGVARIVNGTLQWVLQPKYYELEYDSGLNLFLYKINPNAGTGLITSKGESLIPEGTYLSLSRTPRHGWLLGVGPNSSELIHTTTLTKIALNKRYTSIYSSDRDTSFMAGSTDKEVFLLDKDFNAYPLQEFTSLSYDYSSGLIAATRRASRYKIYLDENRKRKQFAINDSSFDEFKNLTRMANGMYYIELADGRNFIEINNARYLQTPYIYVKYDTLAKWYIGYSRNEEASGTFDHTGATIVPFAPIYIEPMDPNTEHIRVQIDHDNAQLLDNEGKLLFDGKYDEVRLIHNRNYVVRLKEDMGIVNREGKIIVPIRYKYVWLERGRIYARAANSDPEVYDIGLLTPR